MESAYTFSDVMFKPQMSTVDSRVSVDLTTKLGNLTLTLPIVSANMADITEEKMAFQMQAHGGLGIIHRFMDIKDNVKMFEKTLGMMTNGAQWGSDNLGEGIPLEEACKYVGVSVGIGDNGKKRFEALYKAGARTFCIDVAHGHHTNVQKILEWIRDNYNRKDLTIIAGNVATREGASDLSRWGADVIKVGIGPGSCCKTRQNTGVGVPQLYAIEQARLGAPDVAIIADGGIKETGDIGKAIAVGADAVMVGGFLAGTTETPGHVYENMDGTFYKTMAGSASAESKVRSGQKNSFVEGGIRQVPFRGKVKYILEKTKENIQSAFSYNGARNVTELREKYEFISLSGGGKKESKY